MAGALALSAGVTVAGAGPARADAALSGSAVGGPCAPNGTAGYDPVTTRYDCTGVVHWTGSFSGDAVFHSSGTLDLVTGDATGTIEERFYGVTSSVNGTGVSEVLLRGTLTIRGDTGETVVRLKIVDGTGFALHAKGAVTLKGTSPLSGIASFGTYSGSWRTP